MTINNVSNISTTQNLVAQLSNQSATLDSLSEELASGKQYDNLTSYAPGDAVNLLNLQSSSSQLKAYSNVINTVQSRLSTYDTTMTDMESIVSQSQSLVNGSQNYSAETAVSIAATAQNYLKSVQIDLNQQLDGRYIYAGTRYTTAPVADFTTLTDSPSTTILTDGASLPDYDTSYTASQLTASTTSSSISISGTVTRPQNVSAVVNGTTYSYTVQTTDTTAANVATGLAAVLNSAGYTGTAAAGGTITVGGGGVVSSASATMTDTAAYTVDTATIANGYTVAYGVSSDNPAFQKMIAGLRYLQAAGNSTDQATYTANMNKASTLLTSALSAIEAVHTGVANNINTLTTEQGQQSSQMTDLSNQVDDIQSVNITQVSAEITALQAILEASYMVTGDLEKLTIVNYL